MAGIFASVQESSEARVSPALIFTLTITHVTLNESDASEFSHFICIIYITLTLQRPAAILCN